MRDTELQMQEILSRSDALRTRRRLKKRLLLSAGGFVLCLVFLVFVAAWLPHLPELTDTSNAAQYGSLILGTPSLGYVLIGLLCFGLGAWSLLFCLSLRRWKGRERS